MVNIATVGLVQSNDARSFVLQSMSFSLIEVITITIISFVIGFGIGFLVSQQAIQNGGDIRMRVAVFITLIWAISVLATIAVPGYETSIWIHAIMGAIAGYLFGVENPITGGNSNGK